MSRLQELTPHAEIVSASQARAVNVAAAIGLKNVLQTNLGPYGTIKLLVGGAPGQLKCTKDGLVLLKEMQIQHPTACMIARTATAQDDVTGDGTTSTVLLCATLLQHAHTHIMEGLHPRCIVDGLEIARDATLQFLQNSTVYNHHPDNNENGQPQPQPKQEEEEPTSSQGGGDGGAPSSKEKEEDKKTKPGFVTFPVTTHNKENCSRELLYRVALTSLRTKLESGPAEKLANAIVEAVLCISDNNDDEKENKHHGSSSTSTRSAPLDLHRIEILTLPQSTALPSDSKLSSDRDDTNIHAATGRFINGLVLDHGGRHPNMPKVLKNCKIMTCNVSLEYEKTEVTSGFSYTTAEEREKLVESERKWLDERCQQIIQFKQRVCHKSQEGEDDYNFVIINQKGVDPLSLDLFAKHNILCLRRAKRRNMERLTLACGGSPILSLEDLTVEDEEDAIRSENMLGYAGLVTEMTFGDDKYTFVEDCLHPKSCTILLQGPNELIIQQMKDATRDGLRAVKNAIEDTVVIPGAGAFELAASHYLKTHVVPNTAGKAKLGVQVFADALLVIPKTLAINSGFDIQETMLKLQETIQEMTSSSSSPLSLPIGLDCITGEPMIPSDEGIWDNIRVKRQCLYLSTVLASQLLLVDEVMRAGKQMGNQAAQAQQAQQMME